MIRHAPGAEPIEYPGLEVESLRFLMRSGNFFMIDGVTHWRAQYLNGRVISLEIEQAVDAKHARVIVESIDLSQIEAIVILPPEKLRRRFSEKGNGNGE